MRAAWLIARKDIKVRIRDRSALMLGIAVPFGLALIFNAIFGGVSGNAKIIDIGVVDVDHGPVAAAFATQVQSRVGGAVAMHTEPSVSLARSLTAKGDLNATIVIPTGFSVAVQAGQAASLQVIANVDSPISAEVARSIAEGYAADLNAVRLSVATVMARGGGANLPSLEQRAATAGPPMTINDVSTTTKELNPKTFYSAGMAVFFLFFTVQFGVTGLLAERNDGTLARLAAAPIRRQSILGGKLLTSFLLGGLSMTVLVVTTSLLFGASWGNSAGVAVLVVAAVLSAMSIMAVIAAFARNAEQAGNYQSIIAVVLGLLGGTFFPVSRAPGVLSKLTFVTPQAWFLRGLGDLRGGPLRVVWVPTVALMAFAVVFGGFAMTRLRRMAEV